MTTYLPYRANVFCSLGHVIDGQFADSYLQQAGLIFCRGSVRLAGIVRPDVGTVVSFAYTRDNVTAARIPRVLRVLSSFADPFTNITTVQLGCKLTLLQENREPEERVTPEDSNPSLPSNWKDYIAAPVTALSVATKCLGKLGITAAASIPLGNRYTRDFIDLSDGYVAVLGKLLESENLVGWLNDNEQLAVRSLVGPDMALGPVLNNTNVFTLSPIGVGSLPGEAVTVSYSPMRLRDFSITIGVSETLGDRSGWNGSVTYGFPVSYSIAYSQGGTPQTFTGSYVPVQQTRSDFSGGLMVRSITSTSKPYAAAAGKYASQALTIGLSVPTTPVASRTITVNRYDFNGRVVESTVTETQSLVEFAGNLDLTFVFSELDFVSIPSGGNVVTQRTVTQYLYNRDSVRREVHRYVNWGLQQTGQQAVNEGRSAFTNAAEVSDYINLLLGEPAYVGTEVSISDAGPQVQQIPGPAALVSQVYADGESRREVVTELAYVFGGSNAQRVVNFTLPYTGDDYFNLSGSVWLPFSFRERSAVIARNYGRVQNRLRLGNSQGVSLQIPVELMPTKPFDALYLQAGGLTGQYRANGMSWTFDQNGIVGQIDALFWLAIGQDTSPGPIWFPMAPGVTALPTTPGPTINTTPAPANSATLPGGWDPSDPDLDELFETTLPTDEPPVFPVELDVETGLEPFAETVNVDAVTRAVFEIESFDYSLTPQEADMDLVTRAVFEVGEIALVSAPRVDLRLTPQVPFVYAPTLVIAPRADFRLVPRVPDVRGAAYVRGPRADLRLVPRVPVVGAQGLVVAPRADFRLVPQVPTVRGAFDPLSLSPVAWWDASDASTVTTSGGAITDWADKSGNGWTLSQATSSQRPTYDTAAINGLNAALWPSANNDDFLQSASATFTTAEFYIVAKFANSDFNNFESTLNPNSSAEGWTTGSGSGGGLFFNTTMDVYLNGNNGTSRKLDMRTEMSSTCLFRFVPTTTRESTTGVVMGTDRNNASLGRGWNGHICEAIVLSSVLSSDDRGLTETYLMDKWGIT
jgi:hypothetical protein